MLQGSLSKDRLSRMHALLDLELEGEELDNNDNDRLQVGKTRPETFQQQKKGSYRSGPAQQNRQPKSSSMFQRSQQKSQSLKRSLKGASNLNENDQSQNDSDQSLKQFKRQRRLERQEIQGSNPIRQGSLKGSRKSQINDLQKKLMDLQKKMENISVSSSDDDFEQKYSNDKRKNIPVASSSLTKNHKSSNPKNSAALSSSSLKKPSSSSYSTQKMVRDILAKPPAKKPAESVNSAENTKQLRHQKLEKLNLKQPTYQSKASQNSSNSPSSNQNIEGTARFKSKHTQRQNDHLQSDLISNLPLSHNPKIYHNPPTPFSNTKIIKSQYVLENDQNKNDNVSNDVNSNRHNGHRYQKQKNPFKQNEYYSLNNNKDDEEQQQQQQRFSPVFEQEMLKNRRKQRQRQKKEKEKMFSQSSAVKHSFNDSEQSYSSSSDEVGHIGSKYEKLQQLRRQQKQHKSKANERILKKDNKKELHNNNQQQEEASDIDYKEFLQRQKTDGKNVVIDSLPKTSEGHEKRYQHRFPKEVNANNNEDLSAQQLKPKYHQQRLSNKKNHIRHSVSKGSKRDKHLHSQQQQGIGSRTKVLIASQKKRASVTSLNKKSQKKLVVLPHPLQRKSVNRKSVSSTNVIQNKDKGFSHNRSSHLQLPQVAGGLQDSFRSNGSARSKKSLKSLKSNKSIKSIKSNYSSNHHKHNQFEVNLTEQLLKDKKISKKIQNLENQLEHYKRLAKRQEAKLSEHKLLEMQYRKLEIQFKKSQQIRLQQKRIIQCFRNNAST